MIKNRREELERAIKAIKIEVSSPEREKLLYELDRLLHWLEPLLELDTGGVEEVLFSQAAVNVLRQDSPLQADLAELQENAPSFAGGFYLVPRIME